MIRLSGVSLLSLLLSACVYTMSGGGGLPPGIKTMAVLPFENETASAELTQELQLELRKGMISRLGLRDAPEGRANAVVRGRIVEYDPDIPVGISGDQSRAAASRRKLRLVIDIEIVGRESGEVIYERAGVSGEGEYNERQEADGRREAIRKLIDTIIEGAQSQW